MLLLWKIMVGSGGLDLESSRFDISTIEFCLVAAKVKEDSIEIV